VNLRALALAVLLAGCHDPASQAPADPAPLPPTATEPAVATAVQDEPLPTQIADTSGAIAAPLQDAVAAVAEVLPPAPPAPPVEPLVAAPAVSMIIRWEVGSEAQYTRRYQAPVWPKGQSGVTWCIGYDGGHQTKVVISDDWQAHPAVERLASTAGIVGERAKAVLPAYRDILTPFGYCRQVFEDKTLIEYERRTRRTFGPGYLLLRPLARGGLVDLVYNRGGATTGDSRREFRVIRDVCIPKQDYACIAAQLRSMKRLWKGTKIESGMYARREAEAILVETEG
jgi:hypothetical protein